MWWYVATISALSGDADSAAHFSLTTASTWEPAGRGRAEGTSGACSRGRGGGGRPAACQELLRDAATAIPPPATRSHCSCRSALRPGVQAVRRRVHHHEVMAGFSISPGPSRGARRCGTPSSGDLLDHLRSGSAGCTSGGRRSGAGPCGVRRRARRRRPGPSGTTTRRCRSSAVGLPETLASAFGCGAGVGARGQAHERDQARFLQAATNARAPSRPSLRCLDAHGSPTSPGPNNSSCQFPAEKVRPSGVAQRIAGSTATTAAPPSTSRTAQTIIAPLVAGVEHRRVRVVVAAETDRHRQRGHRQQRPGARDGVVDAAGDAGGRPGRPRARWR